MPSRSRSGEMIVPMPRLSAVAACRGIATAELRQALEQVQPPIEVCPRQVVQRAADRHRPAGVHRLDPVARAACPLVQEFLDRLHARLAP